MMIMFNGKLIQAEGGNNFLLTFPGDIPKCIKPLGKNPEGLNLLPIAVFLVRFRRPFHLAFKIHQG